MLNLSLNGEYNLYGVREKINLMNFLEELTTSISLVSIILLIKFISTPFSFFLYSRKIRKEFYPEIKAEKKNMFLLKLEGKHWKKQQVGDLNKADY